MNKAKVQEIIDIAVDHLHQATLADPVAALSKDGADLLEKLVKVQKALDTFELAPVEELAEADADELLQWYQNSSTMVLGEHLTHDPTKP